MKTYLGIEKKIHIKEYGELMLEIMVSSRSDKLNVQTGQIIAHSTLQEFVGEVLSRYDKKSLMDIQGVGYLPHTLEVLASRLWEDLEENLNFEARMVRLKIESLNDGFFVIYDGRQDRSRKRRQRV